MTMGSVQILEVVIVAKGGGPPGGPFGRGRKFSRPGAEIFWAGAGRGRGQRGEGAPGRGQSGAAYGQALAMAAVERPAKIEQGS